MTIGRFDIRPNSLPTYMSSKWFLVTKGLNAIMYRRLNYLLSQNKRFISLQNMIFAHVFDTLIPDTIFIRSTIHQTMIL